MSQNEIDFSAPNILGEGHAADPIVLYMLREAHATEVRAVLNKAFSHLVADNGNGRWEIGGSRSLEQYKIQLGNAFKSSHLTVEDMIGLLSTAGILDLEHQPTTPGSGRMEPYVRMNAIGVNWYHTILSRDEHERIQRGGC